MYYKIFGFEIWDQMDEKVNIFVVGVGSGGIFMGMVKFLKEKNKEIKVVIVEFEGLIINGRQLGFYKIEGIGMELLFDFMDLFYFDYIYIIFDQDVFSFVSELILKEGLLVGSLLGVVFKVVFIEVEYMVIEMNIVVIFSDGSERYLSKNIYEGGI